MPKAIVASASASAAAAVADLLGATLVLSDNRPGLRVIVEFRNLHLISTSPT